MFEKSVEWFFGIMDIHCVNGGIPTWVREK
jgi:hypothetical protein